MKLCLHVLVRVVWRPAKERVSRQRPAIPSLSDFSVEKNDPRLPCHIIPLSRNYGFFGWTAVLQALDQALVPPTVAADDDSRIRA